jgi:hypothetical protein
MVCVTCPGMVCAWVRPALRQQSSRAGQRSVPDPPDLAARAPSAEAVASREFATLRQVAWPRPVSSSSLTRRSTRRSTGRGRVPPRRVPRACPPPPSPRVRRRRSSRRAESLAGSDRTEHGRAHLFPGTALVWNLDVWTSQIKQRALDQSVARRPINRPRRRAGPPGSGERIPRRSSRGSSRWSPLLQRHRIFRRKLLCAPRFPSTSTVSEFETDKLLSIFPRQAH